MGGVNYEKHENAGGDLSVQDAACSTIHQDTAQACEVDPDTAQEAESVAGSAVSPLSPCCRGSSISTGMTSLCMRT